MTAEELEALILEQAGKPLQIRNDRMQVRNRSLSELLDALRAARCLEGLSDSNAAIPGIRTNRLIPGGTV